MSKRSSGQGKGFTWVQSGPRACRQFRECISLLFSLWSLRRSISFLVLQALHLSCWDSIQPLWKQLTWWQQWQIVEGDIDIGQESGIWVLDMHPMKKPVLSLEKYCPTILRGKLLLPSPQWWDLLVLLVLITFERMGQSWFCNPALTSEVSATSLDKGIRNWHVNTQWLVALVR